MTEHLCPCCRLLGKPSARINFIITITSPNSLVHKKLTNLLMNYSATPISSKNFGLTSYETLMDMDHELFPGQNDLPSIDQTTSSATEICCHGLCIMRPGIDDISNASQIDKFRKEILDILDAKVDLTTEEQTRKFEPQSWILINDPICLEPAFLNVFLQLDKQNSALLRFTFTVLCFLVDEQRLFENWLPQNQSVQDYNSNTYPNYECEIKKFFSFLSGSKYLQEHTLLINEKDAITDDKLEILLQNIFCNKSSKLTANNKKFRYDMEKLLVPCQRTTRSIETVRSNLQKGYYSTVEDRLKSLLKDLQQTTTANDAACRISRLVFDEFNRMNDEERKVYKKQLLCGSQRDDVKQSNTIAAQLVHYALNSLESNNDTTSLLYSIILVICRLGKHFIFRHELFNHTPEIFTLSLLLITQRHYALTLAGLRLCSTILKGDQNEHKYAIAYLKHDPSTARKILDAIKWLLSPYLTLKELWKQEKEKEKENENNTTNSELTDKESTSNIAKTNYFRHAGILREQPYIKDVALLFYASTDHCVEVTEDDVHYFVEVIDVLADPRMTRCYRGENKTRSILLLISDICALLSPILLYSSPSVNVALLHEDRILISIPRTIQLLFLYNYDNEDMIETCIQFYTQFVQAKYKQIDYVDDNDSEEDTQSLTEETTEEHRNQPNVLDLSQDLISSYFDLYRQIQNNSQLHHKSTQQHQLQTLLTEEWKKLDTIKLQQDYQQMHHQQGLLNTQISQLRDELERTRSERDDFRKESIQMAKQIDQLKHLSTTTTTTMTTNTNTEYQYASNPVTTDNNKSDKDMIDELENVLPNEISEEQAERCIKEIYHRRTTFHHYDMRKSMCGSLKHLGSDLYTSSVHFLHELIQNAEDNLYADDVSPCLRIEVDHSYILLSNNEKGLRSKDVLALCSLAVSTKSKEEEHIGEKGVGFKSVFAASNQPMLISHAWRFCFQVPGSDEMSYITPIWMTSNDIPDRISTQLTTYPNQTHLYLPLKLPTHTDEAETFLDQVTSAADPCILLHMRHLKKLEINDKRQNQITIIEKHILGPTKLEHKSHLTFEGYTFHDVSGSLIQLCTSSSDSNRTFRVYTCYIDVPNSMEQKKSSETRLILSFPCDQETSRLTSTVYTGLPVCDLGFSFIFDGDFQLVTSRENVRENVRYNTFLRDHFSCLFVYLILHDVDLRKEFHQYCPSKHTHQLKHSSWWLMMIDNIDTLLKKYLSLLYGITAGKTIRYLNKDLSSLVSAEQLYTCSDIQVISLDDDFLTKERTESLQIESVSIIDILNCFPNQHAKEEEEEEEEEATSTNKYRAEFRLWSEQQNEQWWCDLYEQMNERMTDQVATIMIQKPIYLIGKHHHQRQYLPTNHRSRLLLFISDDPSFEIWKRQLIHLTYNSQSERNALIKSNHVQLLTEERLIEIIRQDHLQLASSSVDDNNNLDDRIIEEIWQDLLYLRSHLDQVNKSTPYLVPVSGKPNVSAIPNAILPTIFGVDIRSFMYPTTTSSSSVIAYPYRKSDRHDLHDILEWEHFLLEMHCQRSSIYLSQNSTIDSLPLLPTFVMFGNEKCARLGELILLAQRESTKECVRQFPIVIDCKNEQEIIRISATFDESLIRDIPSLPRIVIPSHCRKLAMDLGVCVKYDFRTCVTVLQVLSNEKNTNLDLYIRWLSHLQLYVCEESEEYDQESILSSCQLYLPYQQEFYSLKDLLVIYDNKDHHNGVLLVCKYMKLALITSSMNEMYWPFKDLFRSLGCRCEISIEDVYDTVYEASADRSNYLSLGDCRTTLKEIGMETMISLYEYLEALVLKCVNKYRENEELYDAIVVKRHADAVCGSREDLEWRFSISCNGIAKQLRTVTRIGMQEKKIGLVTVDQRLVRKTQDKIVYGCLESKIVQNLSRDVGKRCFILPLIVRRCPLLMSIFDIDYVERRGKVNWIHKNNNKEYQLTKLTDIFRNAMNDAELEVLTAKYATIKLDVRDSSVGNVIAEQGIISLNTYTFDNEYPFWIFNKTILLCNGGGKNPKSQAIIAASALTTLLHKRKHLPFEEAKSIAQQKINSCTEFRSNNIAHAAGAESSIYSYTDLLFPIDHDAIESMTISISNYCTTEKDAQDDVMATAVAPDRMANDQVYRSRIQTQNHMSQQKSSTNKKWTDPFIVDSLQQSRIGENAEHYFFTYLQHHYGSIDVTPTKNWRSSSRLAVYPQCRETINDAAGFDFELHDTREVFVRGSGSRTKYCYFEVKGTSGSYNEEHTRFHISQNELEMCQAIAYDEIRYEQQSYFIVIIENCLDAEKTSLGTVINWSENFASIQGIPNSYKCNIIPSPSTNFNNSYRDTIEYSDGPRQQPRGSGNRYNNYGTQSAIMNNNSGPSRQNEQPQSQGYYGNNNYYYSSGYYQQSHRKKR